MASKNPVVVAAAKKTPIGKIVVWPSWSLGGLIETPDAKFVPIVGAKAPSGVQHPPLKPGTTIAFKPSARGVVNPKEVMPWEAHVERVAAALKRQREEERSKMAAAAAKVRAQQEAAKLKAQRELAAKKAEELAAKKAEEERALAKKKAEEERAVAKKKAEERLRAAKKAEELAAKKAEEERALAKKKAEEERAVAKKKAEEERLRAAKKAEEQRVAKKAEEERVLAKKKAEETRAKQQARAEKLRRLQARRVEKQQALLRFKRARELELQKKQRKRSARLAIIQARRAKWAARVLAKRKAIHNRLAKRHGTFKGTLHSVDLEKKIAIVQVGRRFARVKLCHFYQRPSDWINGIGSPVAFYNIKKRRVWVSEETLNEPRTEVRIAMVTELPEFFGAPFKAADWNDRTRVPYVVPSQSPGTTGLAPKVGSFVEVEVTTSRNQPDVVVRAHVRPHDVFQTDVAGVVLWFDGKDGIIKFPVGDARVTAASFRKPRFADAVNGQRGLLANVTATLVRVPSVGPNTDRLELIADAVEFVSAAEEGEIVHRDLKGVVTDVASAGDANVRIDIDPVPILLPLCLVPASLRPLVGEGTRIVADGRRVGDLVRFDNVRLEQPTLEAARSGEPRMALRVTELDQLKSYIVATSSKGEVFQVPKSVVANGAGIALGAPIDIYTTRKDQESTVVVGAVVYSRVASKRIVGTVLGVRNNAVVVVYASADSSEPESTISIPLPDFARKFERVLLRRWAKVEFDLYESPDSKSSAFRIPVAPKLVALGRAALTDGTVHTGTLDATRTSAGTAYIASGDKRILVRLRSLRPSVRWWLLEGHPVQFKTAFYPSAVAPKPGSVATVEAVQVRRVVKPTVSVPVVAAPTKKRRSASSPQ